jgi:hypothetical protein
MPPNRKGDISIAELLAGYLDFAKNYYVADGKPSKEFVCMKDVVELRDVDAKPLRRGASGSGPSSGP